MATKESALTGLEPRSFWGHFEALTKIARPSRHEEPVIEHVREWADRQGFELEQDAGRNLVDPRPGERRPRGRADRRAPGAPGHRLRARSVEPERPGGGAHRARPRRRVADRGRDDPRCRRRGRDRGDDGAGRGRVAASRAARAADDGGRGGRARGRERARPRARHGLDPDQSRQRGGREADGGVRRQHRHVDPDRGAAGGRRRRCGDARRHGERRAGRPLRDGDRARTVERDQGARPRSARGAGDGALPARLALRRQEPQRDPARRDRGLLGGRRPRAGVPGRGRRGGGDDP